MTELLCLGMFVHKPCGMTSGARVTGIDGLGLLTGTVSKVALGMLEGDR